MTKCKAADPVAEMRGPQQFQKKPIVIEAIQWDELNLQELQAWGAPVTLLPGSSGLIIGTLEDGPNCEAVHIADKGDWIIRGIKGEYYPCKPDIFEATYEAPRRLGASGVDVRQLVIDVLTNCAAKYANPERWCITDPQSVMDKQIDNGVELARKHIALPAGWVSRKERLPKIGKWCLVVIDGHVQRQAATLLGIGFANLDGYEWNWADDEADPCPLEQVSYWQPLPAPPEEKGNG